MEEITESTSEVTDVDETSVETTVVEITESQSKITERKEKKEFTEKAETTKRKKMKDHKDAPLKFTTLLENKEALLDETVEFSCETNRSGIEVVWLKNNRPLSIIEGRYQIVNRDCTYQLIIPSVTIEDSGEYTVQVDDLKATAILTVIG